VADLKVLSAVSRPMPKVEAIFKCNDSFDRNNVLVLAKTLTDTAYKKSSGE